MLVGEFKGKKFYIAYGSNLHIEQMQERCKDAELLGTATLTDHCLEYRGSVGRAYLTIKQSPMGTGESLPLAVWLTSAEDELALDDYEDYPELYYKTAYKVNLDEVFPEFTKVFKQGDVITAYTYVMQEDKIPARPTDEYIEVCKAGYDNFGFNKKILDEALEKLG